MCLWILWGTEKVRPNVNVETVSILYFLNGLVILFLISATRGWGVTIIAERDFVDHKCNALLFFKSYFSLLNNFKFGFFRSYFYKVKLKGMGFKVLVHSGGLILKIGYSHKVVILKESAVTVVYKFKQLLLIKSRQSSCIQSWLYNICGIKPRSVYNQKGFSIKGEKKVIKASNKVKK